MTLGTVSSEKGVLKLVRPGGVVERYTNPTTAAEVMRRNPRHCVTRPDVFKFPWIVVRPESVLNPGQVFFLVPYHTIHRLLQSNGRRYHSAHSLKHKHNQDFHSLSKSKSESDSQAKVPKHPQGRDDSCVVNKSSRVVSIDMMNSKCQEHDRSHEEQYPVKSPVEVTCFHRLVRKQTPSASWINAENRKQIVCHAAHLRSNYADQFIEIQSPMKSQSRRKKYPVERWPTAIVAQKKYKTQTPDDSFFDARTTVQYSRDYASDHDSKLRGPLSINDDGIKLKYSQQIITHEPLKSCLKKHKNNIPRSHLRVTFSIPGEDDDRELRIQVCKSGQNLETLLDC